MKKNDLLLLHGALADQSQFDSLIPHIQDAFVVHTLNFDGHGDRPLKNIQFRIEHFMETVLSDMDAHNLSCVDIFGYSMGGFVGLYLALKYPQRVKRLFTLATKFRWTPEIAAKESSFLNPETMKIKVPHFATALKERHTALGWKNVLDRTVEMFHHMGNITLMSAADYQKISTPVRLSLGDRDKMVGVEETLEVYRCLPQGQLQIFPDTYHPFERVSANVLATSIISFFSG